MLDSHPVDPDEGDPRVEAAVLALLKAQDQGTPIDRDAWLSNYSEDLRIKLGEILVGLDLLHRPRHAVSDKEHGRTRFGDRYGNRLPTDRRL